MSVCSGTEQVRLLCGDEIVDTWWDDGSGFVRRIREGVSALAHKPGGRCPDGAHRVVVRSFGAWVGAASPDTGTADQ